MLDAIYRRRLERDIETWREKGWVTADGATAILASLPHDGRTRTATVIGFLGAVLIAFAAIAFVAANWEAVPRPMRLAVLVAGMGLCYAIAGVLQRARHTLFADAAIFAGAALFGASIVLVAQSYHMSGDYPDALLLWAGGALLAAMLGPSRASLLLALLILCLWSWYEVTDFGWVVHWPFLPALALVVALAAAWGWAAGLHLTTLALLGWIGMTVVSLAFTAEWSAPATVLLLFAIACVLFAAGRLIASRAEWHIASVGPALSGYGLLGLLGLLMLLQMMIFSFDTSLDGNDEVPVVASLVAVVIAPLLLLLARSPGGPTLADAGAVLVVGTGTVLTAYLSQVGPLSEAPIVIQLMLGILGIGAALWAIAYGNRIASRVSANLGLIAFAAEILYLYFVTFGTLLDTALFFLIGGVLLIALAFALVRIQRRLSSTGGSPPNSGAPNGTAASGTAAA